MSRNWAHCQGKKLEINLSGIVRNIYIYKYSWHYAYAIKLPCIAVFTTLATYWLYRE